MRKIILSTLLALSGTAFAHECWINRGLYIGQNGSRLMFSELNNSGLTFTDVDHGYSLILNGLNNGSDHFRGKYIGECRYDRAFVRIFGRRPMEIAIRKLDNDQIVFTSSLTGRPAMIYVRENHW